MGRVDPFVRRAGKSIDLSLAKSEARRLGPKEGRRPLPVIEDAAEPADLVGILKGRVSAKALHAATDED